jgi:hypothetical protein
MATLNKNTPAYFIEKGRVLSCFVHELDWLKATATVDRGMRTLTVPRHDVFYDLKRANNELEWRNNKPVPTI